MKRVNQENMVLIFGVIEFTSIIILSMLCYRTLFCTCSSCLTLQLGKTRGLPQSNNGRVLVKNIEKWHIFVAFAARGAAPPEQQGAPPSYRSWNFSRSGWSPDLGPPAEPDLGERLRAVLGQSKPDLVKSGEDAVAEAKSPATCSCA